MSANNGVYILKTGRQYRVRHLTAIDNLYWNEHEKKSMNTIQPEMVLSMFGGGKFTYSRDRALSIAMNILMGLPVCEYGIQMIDAKMSWKDILNACGMGGACIYCHGRGFITVHGREDTDETCPECDRTGRLNQTK